MNDQTENASPAPQPRRHAGRFGSWWIAAPGIVLVVVITAALVLWRLRPHLSDEVVDGVVTAAIQQESKEAFLVTGYLEINAQARIENRLRLLPGLLNLSLGSTTVSVRAPGRVHYGFHVAAITPDRITLMPDGVVEVSVPQPEVHTVSPDLARLEIETTVGWTRLADNSADDVRDRALALVQENMRLQALNHMRTSSQPSVNSADAMYALLRPVLIAAGMKDPRFRFRIGRDLVMEPRAR
ncbi:MAG: DUF4230 domain-containing protein [Longimicrobiales bacterium]